MKKFHVLTIAALAACLLGLFAAEPARAADGTPCDVAIALPGGTTNVGTSAYTTGIMHPANSALRPLAVSYAFGGVAATNGTITLRKAAGGPAWATITLGNTEATSTNYVGVTLLTSEWYWRRGDTVHVTASVTNACSITLHGLER